MQSPVKQHHPKRVLGIETSCDETAVALYDSELGLLGHAVYSQVPIHANYGGVVPELASRDHVRRLLPMISQLLAHSHCAPANIDAVAYTAGPGLVGALLVGAALGRSLAFAWNVRSLGIYHMEAHLLAPMLEDDPPEFPFLALLVSGGHTLLVEVTALGAYVVLGESLDDAAGEAFDKTAKMLGLTYPGGPALASLAIQGDPKRFHFPRPMTDRPGLNFSFSGLKTHAIHTLQRHGSDPQTRADIARAFEEAIVDTLLIKTRRALRSTGLHRVVVSGGVGANQRLRLAMAKLASEEDARVHYPRIEFCTDNGAMVAYAGYQRLAMGAPSGLGFTVKSRWSLAELASAAR